MNNMMAYRGYTARIEYDDEDGIFFGHLAGIRDGVGFHADNVADLKAAFHEAVDDYIEACAKIGKEPQRASGAELTLPVDPDLHARIARAAERRGESVETWSERALRHAVDDKVA